MLILKINMRHWLGKRHKNKTKMIGITLNKVFMMNLFNKRKSMRHRKQKIWNQKFLTN